MGRREEQKSDRFRAPANPTRKEHAVFTRDDLMALLRQSPLVPFRLYLSDGTSVDVFHRDFVTAGRRYAAIGIPDPADPDAAWDRSLMVFYMHMTKTETLLPGPSPGDSPPPTGLTGSPDSPTPSPSTA